MKLFLPGVIVSALAIFGLYAGVFDIPLSPLRWTSEIVSIPAEIDGKKLPRYGVTLSPFAGNVSFTKAETRIFVTLIDEGLIVGSPFTPTKNDLYKSLLTGYAPFKDLDSASIRLLQGGEELPLLGSTLGKKFATAYRYDAEAKRVTGIANRDGSYQTNLVVLFRFGPLPPERRHDLVLLLGEVRLPLHPSWTPEQIANQSRALHWSFAAGGGVLLLFAVIFLVSCRRE